MESNGERSCFEFRINLIFGNVLNVFIAVEAINPFAVNDGNIREKKLAQTHHNGNIRTLKNILILEQLEREIIFLCFWSH